MTPHQRIRLARRHAGCSQAQLAKTVGVLRSAVSHWESPLAKNPSIKHLREIALATGVQFEWLATGRGEMVTTRDAELDAVAAADAMLVEDPVEQRLLLAYRAAPLRARLAVVELIEELAMQRTGRPRPAGRPARGLDAPVGV